MNQKLITCTFILFSLALASADMIQPASASFNVLSEIKQVEDSDFGKKLMDTIALQLGAQAPLEDVAKLLINLKNNLYSQQKASDDLHRNQEQECKRVIADYVRRINHATFEITGATNNIANLRKIHRGLARSIRNRRHQLAVLVNREKTIRHAFKRDSLNFAKRQKDHAQVVGALDIIIPKLRTVNTKASRKAVFAELAKIGQANPIAALVQVAMTLNPAALQNVVNKLSEIRRSVAASLEDDKKSQRKAVVDYNVLLKEISFVRVNTKKTLNKEKKEIISIKSRLRGEEKRRSDANSVLKSSNAGKSAKSADCQRKRTNWVSESKHRAYEISIVSKLQKFLATRYETMKGYLSKRKSSK